MAWHRLPHLVHFVDLRLFLLTLWLFPRLLLFFVSGFWIIWTIYIGLGDFFFLFAKGPRHAPGAAYVDAW